MDSSLRDSLDSTSSAGPARARKPAKGKAKASGDVPSTEELLVVSVPKGSNDVKIQVSSVTVGTTTYPLFFLPSAPAVKFKDGVTLVFQSSQQTSTIHWYLDNTVAELVSESPALVFSSVQNQQQTLTTQAGIFNALAAAFVVRFANGKKHDPQIIVTPIGGTKQSARLPVKKGPARKNKGKVVAKSTASKKAKPAKRPAPPKRKKR